MTENAQTALIEGAPAVEAASAEFRRALVTGDSVLTPGAAIWTLDNAQELHDRFNGQPDISGGTFEDKLANQFADATSGAVQLFAELFALDLLPLEDYNPSTKRKLIASTLALAGLSLPLPPVLDQAFYTGVLAGGVAFKSRRYFQLCFLIEFAAGFLAKPADERQQLLADPLEFRTALDAVTTTKAYSQRATLLFLFFPDFYFAIASEHHRRRILKAFSGKLARPSGDPDQDLHDIYATLLAEAGEPFHFYQSPYREEWYPGSETADITGQRAWLVRGNNVKGHDLVPAWLDGGKVTLAAEYLGAVEAGASKDELKPQVEAGYSFASYTARRELLDAFYQFLAVMQEGDLLCTIDQGRLYVGQVAGSPAYDPDAEVGAVLVREAQWVGAMGLDLEQLPGELKARLGTPRDVLDLTQHLAVLEQLASTRPQVDASVVVAEAVLPDATPELSAALHTDQAWLQKCIDLLRDRPQLIFYGPPGTGKTYIAQQLARHLAGDNVSLVQFHPAYSYEDFFEGFRPVASGGFELKAGPLRRIASHALANPADPHVLIIDEINRANLAKVFGELYFLLEYREQSVELLYSDDGFSLPKNFYLIGTMNTADRSIALVDAAMRRRFAFLPLHPSEAPTRGLLRGWLLAKGLPNRNADLLDELNSRIDDADFKIGPSYLMRPAVYEPGGLSLTWETAILPLLEEHYYGQLDRGEITQRFGLTAVASAVDGEVSSTGTAEEPGDAAAPDPS